MIHDFELILLPDPQSILRVLGLFAQRQMVPQSVQVERRGDALHMAISASDLDAVAAQILADKLQQLLVVMQCHQIGRAATLAA